MVSASNPSHSQRAIHTGLKFVMSREQALELLATLLLGSVLLDGGGVPPMLELLLGSVLCDVLLVAVDEQVA